MKKKNISSSNYLEKIPFIAPGLDWVADDDGNVTLNIKNKGIFNRIAQKLFKKPEITRVHLDETGSFVWPLIDGKKSIAEIGVSVREYFGDKAEPLYERLAKYFQILDSCGFICWKEHKNNHV